MNHPGSKSVGTESCGSIRSEAWQKLLLNRFVRCSFLSFLVLNVSPKMCVSRFSTTSLWKWWQLSGTIVTSLSSIRWEGWVLWPMSWLSCRGLGMRSVPRCFYGARKCTLSRRCQLSTAWFRMQQGPIIRGLLTPSGVRVSLSTSIYYFCFGRFLLSSWNSLSQSATRIAGQPRKSSKLQLNLWGIT